PSAAKEQTMYRGDVPTCRYPHSGADEGHRRLVRPPDPSGPQRVLDEAHDNRGALTPARPGERTGSRRHPEPHSGSERQRDEVSTPETRPAKPLHHVHIGHHTTLPPRSSRERPASATKDGCRRGGPPVTSSGG